MKRKSFWNRFTAFLMRNIFKCIGEARDVRTRAFAEAQHIPRRAEEGVRRQGHGRRA